MVTTPSDTQGFLGQSVRLSCRATGVPPPTITWKFNSNTILPSRKYAVDSVGNLDITDLRKSDEGVYTCQASNDEGFAVADARVTVQGGERKREKEREREIADSLRAEINVFLDVIFEMLLL